MFDIGDRISLYISLAFWNSFFVHFIWDFYCTMPIPVDTTENVYLMLSLSKGTNYSRSGTNIDYLFVVFLKKKKWLNEFHLLDECSNNNLSKKKKSFFFSFLFLNSIRSMFFGCENSCLKWQDNTLFMENGMQNYCSLMVQTIKRWTTFFQCRKMKPNYPRKGCCPLKCWRESDPEVELWYLGHTPADSVIRTAVNHDVTPYVYNIK